jgi:CDP-diacylglycerol--glycerol-3-phosphate 3-phosphatidyltransferase
MSFADQLTVARIAATPFVLALFVWHFPHHDYVATVVFALAMTTDWFDGRIARSRGRSSALGSLLDPIADKVLVLSTMVVLVEYGAFPGWLVALIVAREFLVSGLRLAAIERGAVMKARDLGKLKTWAQACAVGLGGLQIAGAWSIDVALWAGVVALALTWLSALDYARVAPALLRSRQPAGAGRSPSR